jgi:hypothetical protein
MTFVGTMQPHVAGRQGLLPGILLADCSTQRERSHPHMQRVPILRPADPPASAGAPDHPPHMAARGLGPRHGRASTWWTSSPNGLRQNRSSSPAPKRLTSFFLTSFIGLVCPTPSSRTTAPTSWARSSWILLTGTGSRLTGHRSDTLA